MSDIPSQLPSLENPITPQMRQDLEDSVALADSATALIAKAEAAGIDVSAQARQLSEQKERAKRILGAF